MKKKQIEIKYSNLDKEWEVAITGNGFQWEVVFSGNKKEAIIIYKEQLREQKKKLIEEIEGVELPEGYGSASGSIMKELIINKLKKGI